MASSLDLSRTYTSFSGVDIKVVIDGSTPLLSAAAKGHLDVVQALIAAGADINKVQEIRCSDLDVMRCK